MNIADWLHARYPEDMTVVIQHWFDNLVVTDEGFSITLNFGDNPEPLEIPFDAVRTFVDPSVEFEETLVAVDRLIREGKVRYFGGSDHTGNRLIEARVASGLLGVAPVLAPQPSTACASRPTSSGMRVSSAMP